MHHSLKTSLTTLTCGLVFLLNPMLFYSGCCFGDGYSEIYNQEEMEQKVSELPTLISVKDEGEHTIILSYEVVSMEQTLGYWGDYPTDPLAQGGGELATFTSTTTSLFPSLIASAHATPEPNSGQQIKAKVRADILVLSPEGEELYSALDVTMDLYLIADKLSQEHQTPRQYLQLIGDTEDAGMPLKIDMHMLKAEDSDAYVPAHAYDDALPVMLTLDNEIFFPQHVLSP